MPKTVWQPDRTLETAPKVPLLTALKRGLLCQCPVCGQAKLFNGYLRVVRVCSVCATPLGSVRADDAPPYFTLVAVAHIVVPVLLTVERHSAPSLWLMTAIFLPMTAILTLALLRPIKGATVGAMLTFGMVTPPADG